MQYLMYNDGLGMGDGLKNVNNIRPNVCTINSNMKIM